MDHRAGNIEDRDDDGLGKESFEVPRGWSQQRKQNKINIPFLLSWALKRV